MLIIGKTSRFAAIVTIVLLMCMSAISTAFATNNGNNDGKYLPTEVIAALGQESIGVKTLGSKQILNDVILPSSMNIEIPNINMEKVIDTIPLASFEYDFKGDLIKHGYTDREIADFMYEDYRKIEENWKLDEEQIKTAKSLYPELKNVDISNWTNADFRKYYTEVDKADLEKRFTKEQLQKLKQKGIRSEDIFYLFKEFHTVDTILAQTDEALKETIRGYYQFKLDQVKLLATTPDKTKYTKQDMPRYGTDWFLNSVCTNEYWRGIQSDRTLVALRALYDKDDIGNNNSFNGYITNMYGTYSRSQKGAHEGIDFAYGSTGTKIYAIFDGSKVLSGGKYHQLSVYDKNVDKTYNFLHMSYIDVTSGPITHGNYVGKQGKEGNATGPHVHFEVHSGSTTKLSPENDDVLGSISPYQLQIYLGELE